MSGALNIADLISRAETALIAGNADEADTLIKQAEQAQRLNAVKATETVPRLDFGAAPPKVEAAGAEGAAIKAAYVRRFGEIDTATTQVIRELYGTTEYAQLRAMKMADMNRYMRTGQEGQLSKLVLLTPGQIEAAIMGGVPVQEGGYNLKATMVEAQDTLLGYLVPEEQTTEMIQRLPGLTVVRGLARKMSTSRDKLSMMVRRGGTKQYIGNIRSKQTSESPSAGTYDTNALFGKIEVPVFVNLSKVPVSKSAMEDVAVNLMSEVLMPEFSTEAAIKEDIQFLTGSGVNEPQGILNGTSANGAPWNGDIVTQNSGAAAGVTFDAFVKAPFKLAGQYRQRTNPSTAWVWTSTTAGLVAELKDGVGNYLWREMYGNNAIGVPDTMRGWQVKETEAMPEVAANTYPIVFGDFSGYRIVDRIGMSIQRYDDSATADTDSVVFFCRRRYGGQVLEGYRFVAVKIAAPIN